MMRTIFHRFTVLGCAAALVFCISADLSAQSKKDQKKARQLAEQGQKEFRQRNYRNAVELYSQSVALVPINPDIHFWKGAAHFYLDEFDPALSEFELALSQGYKKPLDVYLLRWRINYDKKNYDAALSDLKAATAIDPNNPEILLGIGDISLAKNEYRDALDAYQKVALKNPDNADLYVSIAKAQLNLGDSEGQTNSAAEAVKKRTRFLGEAFFLMGDGFQKQRKYSEAIDAYQKAISAKPDLYDAYEQLADAYRNENRYKDAIDILRKALRVFPNDGPIYTNLGWYYSLADRFEEAVDASKAGTTLLPNESAAYTNLCRAYNDVKKAELAINECNKALKIKPNDGETYFYLGRAHDLIGKTADATKYYSRAVAGLEEYTKANSDNSDGYYLLGNAYFADNKRDKAIESYKKALELSPKFAKARYNLGIIYTLEKNKAGAMEQYSSLLEVDKGLADKLKTEVDKL